MCKFVVNLSDVLDNFNKIKSTLDKNVKVCVVVKANAYGFGMPKIVNLLKNRADFFAVARLSEFWEYKKLNVELPCLILSPLYGNNLKVAIKNGAHITLSSSCDLTEVDSLAKKMGVVANVHLKIDTGMARFGYTSLTVIKQLLKQLKKCKNIKLFGCYSHFADSQNEERTVFQREQFERAKKLIQKSRFKDVVFHIASSKASVVKNNQYDMVRLGIDLYYREGNSHTFECDIVEIKLLKAGSLIGYGGSYKLEKDTYVAVCSAGYADGVNRLLSNNWQVLINNKRHNIIGSICMDSFMVDLGQTSAKVGDRVIIFGKNAKSSICVCEMADKCDTIIYEIFTSISNRVKRVYKWRNNASNNRQIPCEKAGVVRYV